MPGQKITETYTDITIVGPGHRASFVNFPCTVKEGESLAKGEVVAFDGDYVVAYEDGVNEPAVGIIFEHVDATDEAKLSNMFVKGQFITAALTGYDAAALADMGGRAVGDYILI